MFKLQLLTVVTLVHLLMASDTVIPSLTKVLSLLSVTRATNLLVIWPGRVRRMAHGLARSQPVKVGNKDQSQSFIHLFVAKNAFSNEECRKSFSDSATSDPHGEHIVIKTGNQNSNHTFKQMSSGFLFWLKQNRKWERRKIYFNFSHVR